MAPSIADKAHEYGPRYYSFGMYFWIFSQRSAAREEGQCGWLKDKHGLSWQITPTAMDEMMGDSDAEQKARVTQAFLQMKKFDIAALQKAYNGK